MTTTQERTPARHAVIRRTVKTARKGGNGWGARHADGMHQPRPGHEAALVGLVNALAEYIDGHATMDYKVADDGYCGPYWRDIASAAVKLLSGPTGEPARLDGGTMDGMLRDLAELAGFDSDDL